VQKLRTGVAKFRSEILAQKAAQFAELAEGQHPRVLLVTCSDSRIDPSLLCQTDPGELFVIRNAGNIVPPEGSGSGGEIATSSTRSRPWACPRSSCAATPSAARWGP
jgi:carbonic anhydrase